MGAQVGCLGIRQEERRGVVVDGCRLEQRKRLSVEPELPPAHEAGVLVHETPDRPRRHVAARVRGMNVRPSRTAIASGPSSVGAGVRLGAGVGGAADTGRAASGAARPPASPRRRCGSCSRRSDQNGSGGRVGRSRLGVQHSFVDPPCIRGQLRSTRMTARRESPEAGPPVAASRAGCAA